MSRAGSEELRQFVRGTSASFEEMRLCGWEALWTCDRTRYSILMAFSVWSDAARELGAAREASGAACSVNVHRGQRLRVGVVWPSEGT